MSEGMSDIAVLMRSPWLPQPRGIVTAVRHLSAILRIAQHRDEDLIELQIAAAGIGEGTYRLAVGLAEDPRRTRRAGWMLLSMVATGRP